MTTFPVAISGLALIIDEQPAEKNFPPVRAVSQGNTHKSKTAGLSKTDEWKNQSHAVAYTLAHEVRNPLTNIYLALELLQTETDKNNLRMYFDIIRRNTDRISALINDMLNSFVAKKEPRHKYAINQLLDESLEMAKDRIALKMINVEKFYEPGMCEVMIEEAEIKIAFVNIIINALEAMPTANGELKITTSSKDGICTVIIEDNGTGISPANIGKLFEPYFTTKPRGIGLGLAVTQHILQSQQAAVRVESEEGKGTSFIISFDRD
ncbi:MAG TPA: ATP-binding protein [Chitinophagales bacterium]|nr:ATP-binding protein [Chitinophagales bacterium]